MALGPGEPELVPAGALEALRAAGSAAPHELPAVLRASLDGLGVRLDEAAPTAARPMAPPSARARPAGARQLPERPLLARQAAQAAAGALLELTARAAPRVPMGSRPDGDIDRPAHRRGGLRGGRRRARGRASPKLLDELGDLLFQTTFLALLCEEAEVGRGWTSRSAWPPSCGCGIPGCSASQSADTAGDARNLWEGVKVESEGREGIFHDVPRALPALLEARKVQRRAAAIGFEYATAADAFADLENEVRELRAELGDEPEPEREPLGAVVGELGDVLFACVNVARRHNSDPELALRAATARFRERVELAERLAAADGVAFRAAGMAEQERYYQAGQAFSQGRPQVTAIASVHARQVLDSRGNPTVEVDVVTDAGAFGRAAVPSGASTGSHEAVELRDGGAAYGGKAVEGAVASVNGELGPGAAGHDVHDQRGVDRLLCELDGTPNKARIGANGVLGVSLAVAQGLRGRPRAAALALAGRAVARTSCPCR